jgi:formylglycine-generating enzyme required for sulfatase activity
MDIEYRTVPFLVAALVVILSGCGSESVPTSGTGVPPTRPTEAPNPTRGLETSDTRTRIRDGMVTVYVPAGQFEMGSSDVERAQPAHMVALDAFWIDKTEVTNAMFTAFLNEQGNQVEEGVSWLEPGAGHRGIVYGHIEENDGVFRPQTGYEDHPVIEVSWYGAAAYCSWIGGRLPTEAEWEYAARGPQAMVYPWGNTFDGGCANYCDVNCSYDWRDTDFDDGFAQWAPVGSYPGGASWCGALDMAGNVWGWVSDWWSDDYYAHSPANNPQGPDTGTLRIARGGSWFDESWRVSPSCRKALTPSSYRMHWVGFRCVVPAPTGR